VHTVSENFAKLLSYWIGLRKVNPTLQKAMTRFHKRAAFNSNWFQDDAFRK